MELSGCRSWKRARDFLFHADLMTRSLWKARRPIGDERASRCAIECLKKESLRWKVSRNVFGRPRIPNDRAQSSPNLSRPRLLRAYPIQPALQSSARDNHDQHMDSSKFFCALLARQSHHHIPRYISSTASGAFMSDIIFCVETHRLAI